MRVTKFGVDKRLCGHIYERKRFLFIGYTNGIYLKENVLLLFFSKKI